MVSLAAFTDFQAKRNPKSHNIVMQYTCIALRELQVDIDNFSPKNADAVLNASIALGSAALDWSVPRRRISTTARKGSFGREDAGRRRLTAFWCGVGDNGRSSWQAMVR